MSCHVSSAVKFQRTSRIRTYGDVEVGPGCRGADTARCPTSLPRRALRRRPTGPIKTEIETLKNTAQRTLNYSVETVVTPSILSLVWHGIFSLRVPCSALRVAICDLFERTRMRCDAMRCPERTRRLRPHNLIYTSCGIDGCIVAVRMQYNTYRCKAAYCHNTRRQLTLLLHNSKVSVE